MLLRKDQPEISTRIFRSKFSVQYQDADAETGDDIDEHEQDTCAIWK